MKQPATSKEAYNKPENKAKRMSNAANILGFLRLNRDNPYTAPEISKNVGLDRIEVTRRMSEVCQCGVEVVGKKKDRDTKQMYQAYQYTGAEPHKSSKVSWKDAYERAIDEWFDPLISLPILYHSMAFRSPQVRIKARAVEIREGK